MNTYIAVQAIWIAISAVGYCCGSCDNVQAGMDSCVKKYGLLSTVVREIPWFNHLRELHTLCRNLDGVLACIGNIFTDCDNNEFSDVKTYSDTFSLVCSNPLLSMHAFEGCIDELLGFYDGPCPGIYQTSIRQARHQARPHAMPTVELCRISDNLHDCIAFNVTETCIGSYSDFLTSLFRSRFTPPMCRHIASTCVNHQLDLLTYVIALFTYRYIVL